MITKLQSGETLDNNEGILLHATEDEAASNAVLNLQQMNFSHAIIVMIKVMIN